VDLPDRKPRRRLFSRRPRTPLGLEHCPLCGRDFVNPVSWEPADDRHWWMLLRCGECDAWQEVTVSDAVAQRFDAELDRRADLLARALARLDRQRMAADVETMIAALRRGLIDAADFAR
jgi:hypothetical protein